MQNTNITEAARLYAYQNSDLHDPKMALIQKDFESGAFSDAARDFWQGQVPLSVKNNIVPIFDLNTTHAELSDLVYQLHGERLIDKRKPIECFLKNFDLDESRKVFYERLSKYKVIIKNITLDDSKNGFDNPIYFLREFKEYNINFLIYKNAAGLDSLKKITPPIFNYFQKNIIEETSASQFISLDRLKESFNNLLYHSYEIIDGKLRKEVINVNALKNEFTMFGIKQEQPF